MRTVTYESIRADQAWLIVSNQLDQRNTVLSQGISQMERDPTQLPIASRLMILRFHLGHSLRQLTAEARQQQTATDRADVHRQQWLHIHQLAFLLRQIDVELNNARHDSDAFRAWMKSLESCVYKETFIHLN
jgi:hypothetical protein